MATLYSTAYLFNSINNTYEPVAPKLAKRGEVVTERVTYTLTAAIGASDVINILPMQAGARLVKFAMTNPDLDSGTTAAFGIGNTASATAYLSASAGMQTATTTSLTDAQMAPSSNAAFVAGDTLKLTMSAGPTTASTGTIEFVVQWYLP